MNNFLATTVVLAILGCYATFRNSESAYLTVGDQLTVLFKETGYGFCEVPEK